MGEGAFDGHWCAKHGPIIKKHTDFALKAIKEASRPQRESEED